ncbi:hypothetical protein Rmf_07890 [Roseomonas fluvialis]|uniref:Uncharacterized protein n=2 Tax=Roseomonas fluvialis TaxID=1750527 RepID=A0ABN6NXT5_9PROT|nr:hypothetical protein Rmf_07890 [Roseomonas fluvialis]
MRRATGMRRTAGLARPRWIVAAVLVVAAAAPSAAHAHWEFTRWGMTERQVAAAVRNAGTVRTLPPAERRPVPGARMEYRAAGEFRAGTLRLTVAFAFDARNGGLVCVSARGEATQAEALRARLEREFGPPQERGRDPVSGTVTLGWTRPDEIDLQITPGQPVVLLQCARGV